ncbi:DUF427 domain-containing protein [Pseudonocardiaceae bacterium YIM PH 21723]|nr:DUF427 domain-containing protein [Pseudonocardiaceae bacterium YIM PH 21723]
MKPVGHSEAVPRRIRAYRGGQLVLDTLGARYVWEKEYYPAYYIPEGDVRAGAPEPQTTQDGLLRFAWRDMDSWFEEDEEVFVHPRDPYHRVDALRSSRPVRVEHDGVLLAESAAPVMVFETGLPTRYYLERTSVHWDKLTASDTETACPYKGVTSGYWSVAGGPADIAWAYDFPLAAVHPIAGLVCFYNEKVQLTVG